MTTYWHDLYVDGQRLEYIIRHMNTKYKHYRKIDDEQKAMAYADAVRRFTKDKVEISKIVLGVEEFVKKKKIEKAIP